MPLRIQPFQPEDVPAVRAFNRRLAEGGQRHRFPEDPRPRWLPRDGASPLWQEYYLARDGDAVHGAFILKPQPFSLRGVEEQISAYQLPISEGTVDRRHAMVGVQLLRHAMARQPLLYCLGIGSYEEATARLFQAMKWRLVSCPFFARIVRPYRFLRGMAHLRRDPRRALAMDLLAFSGAGWLGVRALQAGQRVRRPAPPRTAVEEVSGFATWADGVWASAREHYSLIAVRTTPVLQALYPAGHPRFVRLRVRRAGTDVGWAVLLATRMEGSRYFGNLFVGTVVDCLAVPGEEATVVWAATRALERRKVDLAISNQLHAAWCAAFARAGYLRGPSNFIFAAAPALVERIAAKEEYDEAVRRVHMTRGDGDGPINL